MFLLGHMTAAGVALPAAVAAARESSANAAVREGLAEAGRRIERGERVAAALAATGIVPELALELVRVGEETGDLAPMLLKAGDILRQEIEAATNDWLGDHRAAQHGDAGAADRRHRARALQHRDGSL